MAGMTRQSYPSDVSDAEWAFVAPYLALLPLDTAQRRHDLREVFNALRYLVRSGAPWRMLPNDLPQPPVYNKVNPADTPVLTLSVTSPTMPLPSVYDLVVFRRLATPEEVDRELGSRQPAATPGTGLASFYRIRTRAVGFVVFDRLLVSVQMIGNMVYLGLGIRILVTAARSGASGLTGHLPSSSHVSPPNVREP